MKGMKKSNLLKLTLLIAVAIISGINVHKSHKDIRFNVLTMANIEALADREGGGSGGSTGEGNGNYEFPDGAPYETTCGVSLGGLKKCRARIVNCQGGGSGCNRQDCPVHPRFN